tara:strand:- start:133 stop:819 length:687 start_codon:yes stop_codon:yes gene_type:complete
LILAKRLSEKQKEEIIKSFTLGQSIDTLAKKFNCTKITITRNLKKNIGEKKFNDFINKTKSNLKSVDNENKKFSFGDKHDFPKGKYSSNISFENHANTGKEEDFFPLTTFTEIMPLDCEIENTSQKDLSSIPISDFNFPKIVYMIVDKNIELETKYLNDYPEWQFLSKEELKRKIIEIFFDLKIAKRFCNKEQKVIKVPNTNVFKTVAPLLISRGISRIVTEDKLIAL